MFGHYRLDGLIGRGGMGEVWRAHDTRKRDRIVALKLLPEHLSADEEYRARFQREAEIAAMLREPHVIPIHDYGEIDGRLYLDMRLVDGIDLAAVIDRDGPLAPERAVAILEQVAAALDVAHAEGLIHRDVKPSNVLVTPGPPEFVHLIDFGIARITNDGQTSGTGAAFGTSEYMAPERFLSRPTDHRVDVYALACVLFTTLAGRPPFTGAAPKVMHGHLARPVPTLTTHRVALAAALDDVISRGMAKDPACRYLTAGELAAAARAIITAAAGTPSATVSRTRLTAPGVQPRRSVTRPNPDVAPVAWFDEPPQPVALSLLIGSMAAFVLVAALITSVGTQAPAELEDSPTVPYDGSSSARSAPSDTHKTVPELLGMRGEDAEVELERRGFRSLVSVGETLEPTEFGRVIKQSPAGGEAADPAVPVRLLVGAAPSTDGGG